MRTLADRYCRWFRYEQDTNAKTLRSLDEAPASVKGSSEFQKCLELMAHIVAARGIWLHRLGGSMQAPKAVLPQNVNMPELKRDVESMEGAWAAFLAGLTDADLPKVVDYRNTKGEPFSSTVEDILMQLHGHGVHHRAQIAMLLRRLGAEPAMMDFIVWTREKEKGKAAG